MTKKEYFPYESFEEKCINDVDKKMEQKYGKQMENEILMKMILLIIVCSAISWGSLTADHISCPNCMNKIETHTVAIFGDTWTCPTSTCGYENYNDIKTCPICGAKKP